MKKSLIIILLLCTLIFSGCSATKLKISSLGKDHKIIQYSGGVKIGEWISNGRVLSQKDSDGYFFQDKATGKLLEISGDVQITILN